MMGALSGLRVLEVGGLETLYAGKLLADQGADVILVEPPGGHISRRLPPHAPGRLSETASVPFTYMNGNKKSVVCHVETPAGRRDLAALADTADVVLAGGRPSDILRLGFDPDASDPGTLLVAVTPFGWTGPWAEYLADELVLNALGGMASLIGYTDDRPLQLPTGLAYAAAGLFAAVAAAAGVVGTQKPTFVDVSVQESIVMGLENAAQFHDLEGIVRQRSGGVDTQVGRGVYTCRDGYVYLMLGLSAGSAFWQKFLTWLDDWEVPGADALTGPEWTRRAHIESAEAKATFRRVVRGLFGHRSKDELYEAARERGIPLAPVSTVADLLVSEQFLSREFFVDVGSQDWEHGPAQAPGAPYRASRNPWCGGYAPPRIGQHEIWPDSQRTTDTAPPANSGQSPLAGVRVIDFSWVGAGSYTTRILADLGADVIKVESTTRVDQIRLSPPFRDGTPGVNRSGYFADRNASKRSITVNLKDPAGLQLVHDLIRDADVVANNFSPGTMERLGLGYDDLRAVQPSVIYLAMSMQGQDGPHAQHVGYGLTIAALAGLHALVGTPGREPIGTGTNYPDHIPSPGHAAFAVLCALREQRRTGQGQLIELSQAEVTMAMIGPDIMAQSLGIERGAQDNHSPTGFLHDTFRTLGDDAWIAISVRTQDEWEALLLALDLPGVLAAESAMRLRDVDAYGHVRDWIESRTRDWDGRDLMAALQEVGVRAGVVQTARDVVDRDEQLDHRRHWIRIPHEEAGEFLYNCLPFRYPHIDVAPSKGAPLLGADTHAVLQEAGLDPATIASLEDRGALK